MKSLPSAFLQVPFGQKQQQTGSYQIACPVPAAQILWQEDK